MSHSGLSIDRNSAVTVSSGTVSISGEPKEFYHELGNGNISGHDKTHKFGRAIVGTSYTPLCLGGIWQTPQVGSATTLRVKAGDSNDTAAGTGAREVTLIGLDETGAEVTESLATAGGTASSPTSATFIRLNRYWVSASGVYSTAASITSHAAAVVLENGAGGTDWATVDATDEINGQSEIGAIAVPLGQNYYIKNVLIWVDAAKSSDVLLMQRQSILDTSAPYQAWRLVVGAHGITSPVSWGTDVPIGPFPALTDICFFGKVGAATGDMTVFFEVITETT